MPRWRTNTVHGVRLQIIVLCGMLRHAAMAMVSSNTLVCFSSTSSAVEKTEEDVMGIEMLRDEMVDVLREETVDVITKG